MNDPDAAQLRRLIRLYGLAGFTHEVACITRAWGERSARYGTVARSAKSLARAADTIHRQVNN